VEGSKSWGELIPETTGTEAIEKDVTVFFTGQVRTQRGFDFFTAESWIYNQNRRET